MAGTPKYLFYLHSDGAQPPVTDLEEAVAKFRKALEDGEEYGCLEFLRETEVKEK